MELNEIVGKVGRSQPSRLRQFGLERELAQVTYTMQPKYHLVRESALSDFDFEEFLIICKAKQLTLGRILLVKVQQPILFLISAHLVIEARKKVEFVRLYRTLVARDGRVHSRVDDGIAVGCPRRLVLHPPQRVAHRLIRLLVEKMSRLPVAKVHLFVKVVAIAVFAARDPVALRRLEPSHTESSFILLRLFGGDARRSAFPIGFGRSCYQIRKWLQVGLISIQHLCQQIILSFCPLKRIVGGCVF